VWQSAAAVCQFELRVQLREPATYLYALVFLLLTFAFVSSGTVELVQDRGTLPKLSPLAISLALGGLTAFGQVITTMIAASAVLRDRAWRTDQLVFTTRVSHRSWMIGRWLAGLLVMAAVYSALAVGVVLGAMAPWVARDASLFDVAARALVPWLVITVPTSAAIATILVAAALRTQRLLGVVATALALVFLWQGCEALAQHHVFGAGLTALPNTLLLATLADPFGTVATQVVTADWTDAQRAQEFVPLFGLVGASRVTWLVIAAIAGLLMLRRTRESIVWAQESAPANVTAADSSLGDGLLTRIQSCTVQLALFTVRWTWRDKGWRVIAALGAINVLAHAISGAGSSGIDVATASTDLAPRVVLMVQEHARLFFILLATIYAGELLWRDVDQRSHELVLSAPVSSRSIVLGRVLGIAVAELLLVSALLLSAWSAFAARGAFASPLSAMTLGALWLFVPFIQWTVLSLFVHVMLRNKIAAHLVLIAGWVLAVALDANGVTSPWVRFADPPTLSAVGEIPWRDAVLRAAWWSTVSAVLLALTVRQWRGVTSPR
jgi:ABC-type transport system involved in multi-copper enzyme maturation permease subunit